MNVTSDIAYDNRSFIEGSENFETELRDAAQEWREVEAAIGRARLNHPYGPAERHAMDVFYPAGRPEGLIFFIHGGYWRLFDRHAWSHLANGSTKRGWAVAMPSYTLAPAAKISDITREMAIALTEAAGLIAGPISVTGHSAGGHLAARMACRDVDLPSDVANRLKVCAPISPLADLRPLMDTALNSDLNLDPAEADAESPISHAPRDGVAIKVWVGTEERPAFLDQARWLVDAWPDANLFMAPGRHHFDVIDLLSDPDSKLVTSLIGAN